MPDMLVKCTVCGREQNPGAADSLRGGWPKCCGYTMRLESTKEFIEAVEQGAVVRAIDTLHPLVRKRWYA